MIRVAFLYRLSTELQSLWETFVALLYSFAAEVIALQSICFSKFTLIVIQNRQLRQYNSSTCGPLNPSYFLCSRQQGRRTSTRTWGRDPPAFYKTIAQFIILINYIVCLVEHCISFLSVAEVSFSKTRESQWEGPLLRLFPFSYDHSWLD